MVVNKNTVVSNLDAGSVANYLKYVEINADLADYSPSCVYSFQITTKTGIAGLVSRKRALLRILHENLKNLECWVGENVETIDRFHLVLIRSLYRTTREMARIVDGQLDCAIDLAKQEEMASPGFLGESEGDDDFPF